MPRENHFRMGRGHIRERHKALSADGFVAAWCWLYEGTMFYYLRAMSAHVL